MPDPPPDPPPPPPTTAGTKTVHRDQAPHLTAAALTRLLATPVELLTVAQLSQLADVVKRVSKGHEPTATLGSLLP